MKTRFRFSSSSDDAVAVTVLPQQPVHVLVLCMWWPTARLVDADAQLAQVLLGQLDLGDNLRVRVGAVVEGEDAPAEAGQDDGAKGDKEPKGELNS